MKSEGFKIKVYFLLVFRYKINKKKLVLKDEEGIKQFDRIAIKSVENKEYLFKNLNILLGN